MYDEHVPRKFADTIAAHIRRHALLRPGERVGVAVSGGADSVALLRLLLEMRDDLGLVLSVVHFNHKIRGADADSDQQFVAALAAQHGLEFRCETGDAPAYAHSRGLSLETAARELRYGYFQRLLADGVLDKVATAHTLDDQAETVLLRLIRGAGTRGLAGIHTRLPAGVVRPLLGTTRTEIESYLGALGQPWRDDASNRDLQHARNRVRHVLLPLLERDFNPAIRPVLAQTAEIARAEEQYWAELVNRLPDANGALDLKRVLSEPLALQRRLVRRLAELAGVHLDFEHVEQILGLAAGHPPGAPANRFLELPGGWRAAIENRPSGALLRFQRGPAPEPAAYEYRVSIPGEVLVKELGTLFRVTLVPVGPSEAGYNAEQAMDCGLLGTELLVRNWRAGDRFWPVHAKGPKKIKELLQERHISLPERALWPVAASGTKIVWVRGFAAAQEVQAQAGTRQAVIIQEIPSGEFLS
jgi:tRNA(Ile)-lysidine synthase